ncbi:methyl-accepting chemotaxis protein [Pseudomonas savastanoi]
MREVASSTVQLNEVAQRVVNASNSSMLNSDQQSNRTNSVAAAINELGAATQEIAQNAARASGHSSDARTLASDGQDVVGQNIAAMSRLSKRISNASEQIETLNTKTANIGQILEVITGISQQTNLLALNAAIEAARAGEAGRGFAVVADEVRALAARTQASTGEIETMIGSVQASADQAVRAMGNSRTLASNTQSLAQATGQSLERIAQSIAEINDRNMLIATASEEQSHVAREVDRNLINIQDLSTQTAAGAHQTSASSQELSRLAISFNNLVGKFKV